jgi:hypothetical protein
VQGAAQLRGDAVELVEERVTQLVEGLARASRCRDSRNYDRLLSVRQLDRRAGADGTEPLDDALAASLCRQQGEQFLALVPVQVELAVAGRDPDALQARLTVHDARG